MEKIKKYKKQIFTFITILLLLQFGIFPCLTMANTFANIVGGIALGILLLWLGIELYELVKQPSRIEEAVIEDLKTIKKRNPKHKATTKSNIKHNIYKNKSNFSPSLTMFFALYKLYFSLFNIIFSVIDIQLN